MVNLSVLKFKTGETVFAQTEIYSKNEKYITVVDPFIIKLLPVNQDQEQLYATKWLPYTDFSKFIVPLDTVVVVAPLNKAYSKFYGMSFVKAEMFELNNEAIERISSGENVNYVMTEIFLKMDSLYENITTITGELEFNLEEFKNFVLSRIKAMHSVEDDTDDVEHEKEEIPNEKPKKSKPILH